MREVVVRVKAPPVPGVVVAGWRDSTTITV